MEEEKEQEDEKMEVEGDTQLTLLKMTLIDPQKKDDQEVCEAYNKIARGLREQKPQFEEAWRTLVEKMQQ